MSIEDKLKIIEARADAATPGPWGVVEGMYSDRAGIDIALGEHSCCFSHKNANFVAHSRTDLPRLIQAVRILAEGLKEASSAICSEFCGFQHHELCKDAKKALDQASAVLEGKAP